MKTFEFERNTPKFRHIIETKEYDEVEDEECEVVMRLKISGEEKIRLLCDIVRRKTIIIQRTHHQIEEIHSMYEKLYQENILLNKEKRRWALNTQNSKENINIEKRDSRSWNGRIDEGSAEQEKENALRFNLTRYANSKIEDLNDRSTKVSRRLSLDHPNEDVNMKNNSTIKHHTNQSFNSINLSSIKAPGNQILEALKAQLQVADENQLMLRFTEKIALIKQHEAFFTVLHNAAIELTPDYKDQGLSKNPKDLWRWLKIIFSRFTQMKETPQILDKIWLSKIMDLLKADTKDQVLPSLEELLQLVEIGLVLAKHIARIFNLKKNTPEEILHCVERIENCIEDWRVVS